MKTGERIAKLTSFAGEKKSLTYLALVLSVLSAVLSVIPFYYIWLILEEVLEVMPEFSGAVDIVHNGWMAVLFTSVSVLLYVAALLCSHKAAFRIAKNMRKRLLRHVGDMAPGTYDMIGSGRVRRTIQDSTDATESYLAHQMVDMAGSSVLPLIILVMLFVFDWRLGLACMSVVILGMLAMMSMMNNKELKESMMSYQGELGNINKDAVEYIRGISVVKTFQQTVDSFQNFKDAVMDYSRFVMKYTKYCRTMMVVFVTLVNSAFAAIVFAGLAINGGLDWTDDFLLDFLFYVIFTPLISLLLMKILYSNNEAYMTDDAIMRIEELLAEEPLPEPAEPVMPEDTTVRFENVSFIYPGTDAKAVDSLDLELRPGTVTALVGPSGSGKSTVAKLACRFWDPSEGRITVGGVDIRDIGSRNLSDIAGFVFQTNHLFKDTLRNNVRIGKPDASDEEVMAALEAAQCGDIVAKLPLGLDTPVGPGGVFLSGGEVQRIAISRTILRDPEIIVLDEATAFADPENELLVQMAFRKLVEDKTVLMIAHRLTTVRKADTICVMESGRIAETGTHETLRESGGRYGRMWDDYQSSLSWKVTGVSE